MNTLRKTTLYILLLLLVSTGLYSDADAAINPMINYQGRLTDSSGNPVSNGDYNMVFRLYTASSGGSPIFTETLTGNNRIGVVSGLFSVMVGSSTPITAVDFNQTLYLSVEIGGTDSVTPTWDGEMSPRKIIGSVPAAFVADTLDGLDSSQFLRSDASGTLSGDLLITGSTTLQSFTAQNATTTNFAVTNTNGFTLGGLANTLLSVNAFGTVVGTSTIGNNQLQNSTISGIALGANLANLSATDSTLTFSGTYNGGTARTIGLNLSNANNWTGLQTFTNASSTLLSSTIASTSQLILSGASNGCLQVNGGNVTSTGVACGSGGGSFAYPWTTLATGEQATSTTVALLNGFISTASSTLASTTVTTLLANGATTTSLYASSYFSGAGLSTCNTSSDKLLWIGGVFSCGTDQTGGGSGTDVNWTFFNNSGIRLATTSNQVLIGFTSTSSLSKLEVVGGATIDISTTTSATSTSLFVSGLASTTNLRANSAIFGDITIGSCTGCGGSTFAYPWTTLATGEQSTSTTLRFGNGFLSSASSTFTGSTTLATTLMTNATATNFAVTGLASTTNLRSNTALVGNLGVATTLPTYTLDVGGNINIDQFSGFKQEGHTILFASSTNASVFVGQQAGLNQLSDGLNNTGIGYQTLRVATSSDNNTALGYQALTANTVGGNNTAVGYQALVSNTFSSFNTALGTRALRFTTGTSNTALGYAAGQANTIGTLNVAIGPNALSESITGSDNIAIGSNSLLNNQSATGTIAIGTSAAAGASDYSSQRGVYIGHQTGLSVTDGSHNNTFVGYEAGSSNSSGANNVLYGYRAGNNITTASNNIIIGYDVDSLNTATNNYMNIGNLLYGTELTGTGTSTAGYLGVGTTTPKFLVHLATSTAPQLVLSDPTAGANGWAFRSVGGMLYLATTSQTSFATSSVATLTINENGVVSIANTATTTRLNANVASIGNLTVTSCTGCSVPSFAYPWTTLSTGQQATSTTIELLSGLISTASSTFTGSTTLATTLMTNATATNFAVTNGFSMPNASNGCLQISGGIISSTGSVCTDSKWATSTDSTAIYPNSAFRVGIGTTTPKWMLELSSSTAPQLTLSDSTAGASGWAFRSVGGMLYLATTSQTSFATSSITALALSSTGSISLSPAFNAVTVNSSGQVGIRTASPLTASTFHINRDASSANSTNGVFMLGTTALTSPSADGTYIGLNALSSFIGNVLDYQLNGTRVLSISSSGDITTLGGTVANLTGTQLSLYRPSASVTIGNSGDFGTGSNLVVQAGAGGIGANLDLQTDSVTRARLNYLGFGVGTTTPRFLMQLSTTSAPQLALSDSGAVTSNHWTFRNSGGLLYLATSSPTSFATSTVAALTISENGIVSIANVATTTQLNALSANIGRFTAQNATTTTLFVGDTAGTGDAGTIFGPVSYEWAIGYKSSDNSFRISSSTSLGTSDAMTILKNGNIGLGTTTPGARLDIIGALCVDDSTPTCANAARTDGTIYSVAALSASLDLAESYPTKDDSLVAGEIVMLDSSNSMYVLRATAGSQVPLVGIVSTKPGFWLGGFNDDMFKNDKKLPIALSGRVPTKVNNEGGVIHVGDRIALSGVSGVGKRATSTDYTVGIALEPMFGDNGVIEVFVNLENPTKSIELVNLESRVNTIEMNLAGASLGTNTPTDQTLIGSILDAIGATINDGVLYLKNLVVETLTIGKTEKPSGITMFDTITGEPYCFTVSNGNPTTTNGKCGESVSNNVQYSGGSGGDSAPETVNEEPISPDSDEEITPDPIVELDPVPADDTSVETPTQDPTTEPDPVPTNDIPVETSTNETL